MKKCPRCNRTYSDETLSFCLEDGALLSAAYDTDETLVMPEIPTVVRGNSAAVQTNAELALARLDKELNSAKSEVIQLEAEIGTGPERLAFLTQYYKEENIMSDTEARLAHDRVETLENETEALRVEVKRADDGNQTGFVFGLGVVLSLISALVAAKSFSNGWGQAIGLFIGVFIGGYIVFGIGGLIWASIVDSGKKSREKSLEAAVKELIQRQEQIRLHGMAVEFKKDYVKATEAIAEANEILPGARAEVERIEQEIARNKKLVNG